MVCSAVGQQRCNRVLLGGPIIRGQERPECALPLQRLLQISYTDFFSNVRVYKNYIFISYGVSR